MRGLNNCANSESLLYPEQVLHWNEGVQNWFAYHIVSCGVVLEPNLSAGEILLQLKEYSDTFLNIVIRLSDDFLQHVDSMLTKALIMKV